MMVLIFVVYLILVIDTDLQGKCIDFPDCPEILVCELVTEVEGGGCMGSNSYSSSKWRLFFLAGGLFRVW